MSQDSSPPEPVITVGDLIVRNQKAYLRYKDEFQRTFGRPLKAFYSSITGFDVIAFDRFLKPKKTESAADVVRARYGDAAYALCLKLIDALVPGTIPTA